MPRDSRLKKTWLNMRINTITYFIGIVITFVTRKVFLDQLGTEFMGLTTTVNSLLGFFSMAELGVGASIAYFLYKPLFDDDRPLISETLSIMGFLYRRIGLAILGVALAFSALLPIVFSGAQIPWGIIYYCYYGQLYCAMLGYFINYRANTLFAADQRGYLVNGYFQTAQFSAVIVQAIFAYFTQSFAAFITISILLHTTTCLILNWKFRQVYPWVQTDLRAGREALRRRPEIMRYVRRVFVHKIGGVVNATVTPLVIMGYSSLTTVTFYGNYTMLGGKIRGLVDSALRGTDASVGNLIAEGDRGKIYSCYRELYSIKFFTIAYLTLCLARLNSDVIAVWLGPGYVLPSLLVYLICADLGLTLLRSTTDQFLDGYGLKDDIWVPICRICSLALMVAAGLWWDLTGILAVPVAIQLTLAHIWKPYYLFRSGLHQPFVQYLRLALANALPIAVAYALCAALTAWLGYADGLPTTWGQLLLVAVHFCVPFLLLSVALSWPVNEGLRRFVRRMAGLAKR